jgi:urease beta subunit
VKEIEMAEKSPNRAPVVTKPGEIIPSRGGSPIQLSAGRERVTLKVKNTGDRGIQVGSHYHFLEVNRALSFDRAKAYGMHLDIPAGTSIRMEPGSEHEVTLVAFGGQRRVFGFAGLVSGSLDLPGQKDRVVAAAAAAGFKGR